MAEILVSDGMLTYLTDTQQWIDYDPGAMRALADEMGVAPPEPEEPLYIFDRKDMPQDESDGRYAEVLPANVHARDPEEFSVTIVPDRYNFVVTLTEADYSQRGLHQATINRLMLPKRRYQELITHTGGWAVLLGTVALGIKGGPTTEALTFSAAVGLVLIGWDGPKPQIPNKAINMASPLRLVDNPAKSAK